MIAARSAALDQDGRQGGPAVMLASRAAIDAAAGEAAVTTQGVST